MSSRDIRVQHVAASDLIGLIDTTISRGQSFTLTVKGNSMRPFFTHDKTRVKLAAPLPLRKHDVCLFTCNDKVFLHRLIKQQGETLTFQGDALWSKETVTLDDVIAKVVAVIHPHKTVDPRRLSARVGLCLWRMMKPAVRVLKKRRRKRDA